MRDVLIGIVVVLVIVFFVSSDTQPVVPKEVKVDFLKAFKEFSASFEKEVLAGDVKTLEKRFDLEALVARSKKNIDSTDAQALTYADSFKTTLIKKFCNNVRAVVGKGGDFSSLNHFKEGKDQVEVVFRLIFPVPEEVAYYSFVMVKKNNEVKIVDYFDLVKGELQSEIISQVSKYVISEKSRTQVRMADVYSHMMVGENKKALKLYSRMPLDAQNAKMNVMIKMGICARQGDGAYKTALAEFKKLYPEDISVEFKMLEYYADQKQFAAAHKVINDLDKWTGGDPYLEMYRAWFYFLEGDTKKGKEHIENAFVRDARLKKYNWFEAPETEPQESGPERK